MLLENTIFKGGVNQPAPGLWQHAVLPRGLMVPGLKRRYHQRTPAMALGFTDHLWSVGDILRRPLIPAAA